jgi:hypothetical protein
MATTTDDFLRVQLKRMAVNWRLALNPPDAKIQMDEFRPLLQHWGDIRFKVCVDAVIEGHTTGFFPTLAEFKAFDRGKFGPIQITTCPSCVNTEGWAYITDRSNGREKVIRCTHGRPA